jgi:hypothetical protein
VPSRKADVKDVPVAAAAVNGGTNSVSGGGMFTFEEMMKVAAYMAQIKNGEAAEDAVHAFKIHGRWLGCSAGCNCLMESCKGYGLHEYGKLDVVDGVRGTVCT